MKIFTHAALVVATTLLSGMDSALAGQAIFALAKDFFNHADLVVVVDVKKVTEVVVATSDDQTSKVYVAEAEVLQTLKSDQTPTPENRKIAIVGSTMPMTSAVWEPIEKKQYLAFLNREQGYYRFGAKYAMRPISPEGKVEWIEKNLNGVYELFNLDIEEAIKRITSEQGAAANP